MTIYRFNPEDDNLTASLGNLENYFKTNGDQADNLPTAADSIENQHTGAVTGSLIIDRWTGGIDLQSGSFDANFVDTISAASATIDIRTAEDIFLSAGAEAVVDSTKTVDMREGSSAVIGNVTYDRSDLSTTFGAVVVLAGCSLIADSIASTGNVGLETQVQGGSLDVNTYEGGVGIISRVTLQDGGVMTVSKFALGAQANDAETLQLVGAGSKLSYSGTLIIGGIGDGALLIRDGASQTLSSVIIAQGSTSGSAVSAVNTGIQISGASSQLSITSSITVGDAGDGDVGLLDGGRLTALGTMRMAAGSGSEGNLSIGNSFNGSGISQCIVRGDLVAGQNGSANISLNSAGILKVNGSLKTGTGASATGATNLKDSGSKIDVGADFSVALSGKHNIGLQGGTALEVGGLLSLGTGASGQGTLTISTGFGAAPNVPVVINAQEFHVGQRGHGIVNVFAGSTLNLGNTAVRIASREGSEGDFTLSVKDAAGHVASAKMGALSVGVDGNGTLSMLAGATLRSSSLFIGEGTGKGVLRVHGEDSLLISRKGAFVGDEGQGDLRIEAGGELRVANGAVAVGRAATGLGKVAVTGQDSVLTISNSPVRIGWHGEGNLIAKNAAEIRVALGDGDDPVSLGVSADGVGLIAVGSGSSLDVAGDKGIVVGEGGAGTLTVGSRGRVEIDALQTALGAGSKGTVEVKNAQALLRADKITVDGEGQTTIEILNGGRIQAGQVVIGTHGAGQASVHISGNGSLLSLVNSTTGLVLAGEKEARLQVSDGGTLKLGASTLVGIADRAGTAGHVVVEDAGSVVVAQNELVVVGSRGNGRLSVLDGGHFLGGEEITAGVRATASGLISVKGSGSTLSADVLVLGYAPTGQGGVGRLLVSEGGDVEIASSIRLGSKGILDASRNGSIQIGGGPDRDGVVSIGQNGILSGDGFIKGSLLNNGKAEVTQGDLEIVGGSLAGSGTIRIGTDGELDIQRSQGTNKIADLRLQGSLALGDHDLIITDSFVNANWGVGNNFDAHAGVSGSGDIIGRGARLAVSGSIVSSGGNTFVLNFVEGADGKLRASFTLENAGSGVDITAAIQTLGLTTGLTGVAAGNMTLAQGGERTFDLIFDPSKGSLDGQSLRIVSNFDNVGPIRLKFAHSEAEGAAEATLDFDKSSLNEEHSTISRASLSPQYWDLSIL